MLRKIFRFNHSRALRGAMTPRKDITMPALALLFFVIFCIASWFNHLYICFTEEAWGFLVAGAIIVPIAVIHGAGNFLGVW
jgi:hypothetical protein